MNWAALRTRRGSGILQWFDNIYKQEKESKEQKMEVMCRKRKWGKKGEMGYRDSWMGRSLAFA